MLWCWWLFWPKCTNGSFATFGFDRSGRDGVGKSYAATTLFLLERNDIADFLQLTIDANSSGQRCNAPDVPEAPPTRSTRQVSRPGAINGVARLPDVWHLLDNINLVSELELRVRTLKSVPKCIKGHFLRILTQSMAAVVSSHEAHERGHDSNVAQVRAWKLFLLIPRLILHSTKHGGEAGERELNRRIAKFDAGEWDSLLVLMRLSVLPHPGRRQQTEQQRIDMAHTLIHQGELSHAARKLVSAEIAPGNQRTLNELTNPSLRPAQLSEPLPDGCANFVPEHPLALNKQIFADVLRQCRRGQSSGLLGNKQTSNLIESNVKTNARPSIGRDDVKLVKHA